MANECPKCQTNNPEDSRFCKECGTSFTDFDHPVHTKTLETPTEELKRGSVFAGRYEIIEELGKGGMGKVYKVEDKKVKEEVALKLIKPDISSDKKIIERFTNELRTARKIGHRNVGRMYDIGEEKGSHFITMEYISGQDLKGLIRQSKRLAVPTAVTIAKEICEGLAEAHRLGIVHRDLKPSNVMIDKEGNARIMDFGIARTVKEKGITGAGVMIGTPEYMSPEQAEAKEVDQRSDIYSLGVILYEMVTGQLPFEGETPLAVAMKHKGETPKDPQELNSQISEDLSFIILKCLEKEKENRCQSAVEARTELEKIEQGLPTTERIELEKKTTSSKEITVSFNVNKVLLPAALIVLLTAAATVFFIVIPGKLDPNRYVVAVFENRTGNETKDLWGSIAADVISQGLSHLPDIEIAPTMSPLSLSTSKETPAESQQGLEGIKKLARETGARIVISGFYTLEAEKTRFRAQFTDAKRGKVLIALDPVDASTEELALETLTQRVLGVLSGLLENESLNDFPLQHIPTYKAYQEYRMGGAHFGADYTRAFKHFEKALELDPDFMIPRLGLGVGYGNLGQYEEAAFHLNLLNESREKLTPWERDYLDWALANLGGNLGQEMHFLRKLEKQDPKNYIINYLIGLVAMEQNRPGITVETFRKFKFPEEWAGLPAGSWRFGVWTRAYHILGQFKQELKIARKAQELFPDFLSLKAAEVRALTAMGKIEDVEKIIDESRATISRYGTLAYVMYEAAIELRVRGFLKESKLYAGQAAEEYRDILSENESEATKADLAWALIYADQLEEAAILFESLNKINPEKIEYIRSLGIIEAMMGHKEAALQIYRKLEAINRLYIYGENLLGMAIISAWLGEKEQAVELIKKSLAEGYPYGVHFYQFISLEPLRDYHLFQELIRPRK